MEGEKARAGAGGTSDGASSIQMDGARMGSDAGERTAATSYARESGPQEALRNDSHEHGSQLCTTSPRSFRVRFCENISLMTDSGRSEPILSHMRYSGTGFAQFRTGSPGSHPRELQTWWLLSVQDSGAYSTFFFLFFFETKRTVSPLH
jgi:hypothetical protein